MCPGMWVRMLQKSTQLSLSRYHEVGVSMLNRNVWLYLQDHKVLNSEHRNVNFHLSEKTKNFLQIKILIVL